MKFDKESKLELAYTETKVGAVAILVLVSWLCMVIHNAVELPDLPFYRPEYLFPSLLSLLLFAQMSLTSNLCKGPGSLCLSFSPKPDFIPLFTTHVRKMS